MIPNQWYGCVPFVHYNTIGRGIGEVVDGPGIDWIDEDMFYVYAFNRNDDGTPPRQPGGVLVPLTEMIQGDRPIIEYRRRREALIEAAVQEVR